MNTSKRRIFAGAIALTLVAAACGSDDDSGSDTTDAAVTTDEATADSTATTDEMTGTSEPAATDGGETVEVSGTLVGAGASSQAAAMQGWQAGYQAEHPDATVEYDPVGSGGGRETFLAGGSDFAGSDAALKDEEYEASKESCAGDQGAINLPHYISPIAVAYNLPGVDDLNLSPEVLAGIFASTITEWDDEAIAADNPDAELPSTTINPVHRSDESGTTKNFTDYLGAVAPDVWTFGAIESWDDEGPGTGEGAALVAAESPLSHLAASSIFELTATSARDGSGLEALHWGRRDVVWAESRASFEAATGIALGAADQYQQVWWSWHGSETRANTATPWTSQGELAVHSLNAEQTAAIERQQAQGGPGAGISFDDLTHFPVLPGDALLEAEILP